ncbi:MAG: DCC1-like thiol-disulfide oxidoreductase family protein [Hyphomicrobiaceae bacterium]
MGPTTFRLTVDGKSRDEVNGPQNYLLYDGECPFCTRYVVYTKAQSAFGGLTLLDARQHPTLVAEWRARGIELNDGMLLVANGNTYFGDEALHVLALASTRSDIFNRINALIFRSRLASHALYPIMRCGRNITLRALGRSKL